MSYSEVKQELSRPQEQMAITGNSALLTESEVKVAYPMTKEAVLNLSPADYAWLWISSEYDRLSSIQYKMLAANCPRSIARLVVMVAVAHFRS